MLLPDENVTNIHNKCHNLLAIMHIDFALPLLYHNSNEIYIVHVASFCTVYHALSGLGPVYIDIIAKKRKD